MHRSWQIIIIIIIIKKIKGIYNSGHLEGSNGGQIPLIRLGII